MYWVKSIFVPVQFSAQSSTDDSDALAVVLRLPDRDVVIIRTGTLRQAEMKAEQYRRELEQTGAETFCARHALAITDVESGPS